MKTKNDIPRSKGVVEHNDLINARYDFPLVIHRLFVAGLLLIEREDEELKTYSIPITELMDAYDTSTNRYYTELKGKAEELLKRSNIGFEKTLKDGRRKWSMFPLFSRLEYVDGEGHIEIAFNNQLKDKLLQLKGNFTRYELEYVRHFGSTYSFRVYKWLKQVQSLREDRTLSLDEMRELLVLEDKYTNFAHFRENVLEVARRELDEHADISFDYDLKKKGKKVTHIVFKMRLSEKTRRGEVLPQQALSALTDGFDVEAALLKLTEEERKALEREARASLGDFDNEPAVRGEMKRLLRERQ